MTYKIIDDKIIVDNNILDELLYGDKKTLIMTCCDELEVVEKLYNLNELYLCDIWNINCINLRYYYFTNDSFDNFYHPIINYIYYYNEDDNCYYYYSEEVFLQLNTVYNDTIFYYEDDSRYFYCSLFDFDYACGILYNGNNLNLSCVKEMEYLDHIFMECYHFYEYLYSFMIEDINENNVHNMFNFLEPYFLCLKPYFNFIFFLSSVLFGGAYHEFKKKDVYYIVNMIKEQLEFYKKISVEDEEYNIFDFKLWFKQLKRFINKFKFEIFNFYRRRYPLYFYNMKIPSERKYERFLTYKVKNEKDFQRMISSVYAYDLFEIARIYYTYDIEIIEDFDRFGDDFHRANWIVYEKTRYKDEF